jgi:hypothetical protein
MAIKTDILELIKMIDEIPCLCETWRKAYKGSAAKSPDCPKCNWIDEKILEELKNKYEVEIE